MAIKRGSTLLVGAILLALLAPVQAAPRVAPAFEIGLLDGNTFRLADAKGTAVLLLFWAPW